jgi:ATP-dependent Zn protease
MDNSNVFDSGYQMLDDTYELEKQHNIKIDKIENSEPFESQYNNYINTKKNVSLNIDLTNTRYVRNLDEDNNYKIKNTSNNILSKISNIPKIYIIFSIIFLIILIILLFL